jgi:hypothetical protein
VKKDHNGGVTTTARREYDLLGRLAYVRYGNGLGAGIRYEYEGAYLRRVCRSDNECGNPGETQYLENVAYDALGRRSQMALPGGERVFDYPSPDDPGYDPALDTGRLLSDTFAGAGGFTTDRHYTSYDPLGNVKAWEVTSAAEGLSADGSYTYDERNRLTSWTRDLQNARYLRHGKMARKAGSRSHRPPHMSSPR